MAKVLSVEVGGAVGHWEESGRFSQVERAVAGEKGFCVCEFCPLPILAWALYAPPAFRSPGRSFTSC